MMFTAAILIIGAIAAFALIFPDRTIQRFHERHRISDNIPRA